MLVWPMCKINIPLFSLIDDPVIAWGRKKTKKEKKKPRYVLNFSA